MADSFFWNLTFAAADGGTAPLNRRRLSFTLMTNAIAALQVEKMKPQNLRGFNFKSIHFAPG